MDNQKTKTYTYGPFSITVCQNCFEYRIDHDARLVFHGINIDYLDKHKSPILTPKGEPDVPYYYHYLGKKFIHLGHLSICEEIGNENRIYFGFNRDKIKITYSNLRYLNHDILLLLMFERDRLPPLIEQDYRKELFLPDYHLEPTTEILSEELNCRLADFAIIEDPKHKKRVHKFVEGLEIVTLENSEKIWGEHLNHLAVKCNCNISKRKQAKVLAEEQDFVEKLNIARNSKAINQNDYMKAVSYFSLLKRN